MAASPFLFGKLPAHGDFVSRGMEAAAQQVWDGWASGEIARGVEHESAPLDVGAGRHLP